MSTERVNRRPRQRVAAGTDTRSIIISHFYVDSIKHQMIIAEIVVWLHTCHRSCGVWFNNGDIVSVLLLDLKIHCVSLCVSMRGERTSL